MEDVSDGNMPPATDIPRFGGIGFDVVVLDAPHPAELARFYAGMLGWPVVETEADDEWAETRPAVGANGIAFQREPDYRAPTWPDATVPQQSHLDFGVDDLEQAEAHAIALGARKTGLPDPASPAGVCDSFRVYRDPVGHPFCLVRRRAS